MSGASPSSERKGEGHELLALPGKSPKMCDQYILVLVTHTRPNVRPDGEQTYALIGFYTYPGGTRERCSRHIHWLTRAGHVPILAIVVLEYPVNEDLFDLPILGGKGDF